MAVYQIEEWLVGMVDFNVPEATIRAIIYNNGVEPGTALASCSEKQKDLCLADLYMWLATSSSATSGEYVSDGGWQHQKSNKVVVDRAGLRDSARGLYEKWGSDKAKSVSGKITIKSLYD